MRKVISLFCALLLVLLLVVPAVAEVDVTYDGRVDSFTGEPYDETVTQTYSDRVMINSETVYDRLERMFVYSENSKEVYANVPTGICTTEPVNLVLPEGMQYSLYKDGNPITDVDVSYITVPGAYVLCESMNGGKSEEILRFTILNTVTGKLESFRLPAGFILSNVTRDGEEIDHDNTYVSLAEEGKYNINYRCPEAELVYSTSIVVDHVAPTLALSEVKDGVAHGPVDISDLEEGANIGIWVNGEAMPYAEKLTGSGVYRIVVSDAAGNQSDYQFTIAVYFNISALFLFLALFVLLACVGGYVLYSRKHLRVR